MDEPTTNLRLFFEGDFFTFFIGPNRVKFNLHEEAVSKESSDLHNMMYWKKQEGKDESADYPDIDVETFSRFAIFCYTDFYDRTNYTKMLSDAERLVLSIIADGAFFCYVCGTMIEENKPRHLFPYCSKTCRSDDPRRRVGHCPSCGVHGFQKPSLVCVTCDDPFYHRRNSDKKTKWSRLKAILRNAGVPTDTLWNSVPAVDADAIVGELLRHAKVAVFADKYGVERLQIMALIGLGRDIPRYPVSAKTIPNVVELLKYVYGNTMDGDAYGDDTTHVLRKVVTEFAAAHIKVLLGSNEWIDLVGEGGDLAIDVFKASVYKEKT